MQPSESSTLQLFASLPAATRAAILRRTARKHGLDEEQLKQLLLRDWRITGRPKQHAPEGSWTYWLLLAGRGFGKTLSGAQWTKEKALSRPKLRIGLIAPTLADGRDTMVEGETGLLAILPPSALLGQSRGIAWNRSLMELTLANETKLKVFSSQEPDRLRGPQHHYLWCEEVSSWADARRGDVLESTWSNAKLGCRLGVTPQTCITSTPKPNKLTKALLAIPPRRIAIVRGSSYENRDNLAEAWWEEVVAPYEGTRLGMQEIHAQVLEDVEGALWTQSQIDELRVSEAPPLKRIVVAVDPNASSDEAANSAGVIVCGLGHSDNHGYVLGDRTITRGGPRAWASSSVTAYYDFEADRIVAEKNNGGEMVEITIHTVDRNVPVKLVHASRGKRTRAEPVSSLYEGSDTIPPRVHHVGVFPELEEEMCTWTPEAESPDRMDALVWGLTELMLGKGGGTMTVSVPRGRIPTAADRGAARR